MDDLKLIKKHYGEKLSHLCRELFPTLLETPGKLYTALTSTFNPNRHLYDDIIKHHEEDVFKAIIYNAIDNNIAFEEVDKTPQELLKQAGYTLYECHTEKDIQSFRHYYKRRNNEVLPEYIEGESPVEYNGEELCTFRGDRLKRNYVFFAVKDNADKLKREDFKGREMRDDEYGTSVISIQFSKSLPNTLSIKNRYNHTVTNPDATFSNNLDSIIPGLTKAFEREYGFSIQSNVCGLELPGYVLANDGKYYKYNYEIDNVYYCTDNIIIHNGEVEKYEKERYLIVDYFIIDLKEKRISTYGLQHDSFGFSFVDINDKTTIEDIKIEKNKETNSKTITINNNIIIEINDKNQMIKYKNPTITDIYDSFLSEVQFIESVDLENVETIGAEFLSNAFKLKEINLPKCKYIGNYFLENNTHLKEISLPNVYQIDNKFLSTNNILEKIYMPVCAYIGNEFLENNHSLEKIDLPEVISIEDNFLAKNNSVLSVNLPKCQGIGSWFLSENEVLESINVPKLENVSSGFLSANTELEKIELPECKIIGAHFLRDNNKIEEINFPKVTTIFDSFMTDNYHALKRVILPEVTVIYQGFVYLGENIEEIYIPKIKKIHKCFLSSNTKLKEIDLSSLEEYDPTEFLTENNTINIIGLHNQQK